MSRSNSKAQKPKSGSPDKQNSTIQQEQRSNTAPPTKKKAHMTVTRTP